jgi:type I restriction enzyme S subunit
LSIPIPPLSVQDKIIAVLLSLEDKIEVNNKINSNLEEQAKALFKSWFIDFEPFKGGKFVDSELGMIPKIWMILPFESFISESQDKAMVGFYPAYSVTNNGITPRTEKFKKQLSKATSKEKILRKDDLVFGMSRQILNWGIMQDKIGSVSSAYHVYKIDKEKVNPTYLRYFIKGYQTYFKDLIGTAAREGQSLDKGALMSKIILIPSQDVLQSFLRNITAIEDAVSLLKAQCSRLSSLRDTLLPKLMSGEIEVK